MIEFCLAFKVRPHWAWPSGLQAVPTALTQHRFSSCHMEGSQKLESERNNPHSQPPTGDPWKSHHNFFFFLNLNQFNIDQCHWSFSQVNSDPCAGGQPKTFFLQIPMLPSGELLGNSPGSSINLTPFSSPTACSESIKNHHCVKLCVLILEWFSHTAASYLCDEPSAWGWNYKSGFSFDNGETDAGEKNLLQFLSFFYRNNYMFSAANAGVVGCIWWT